jgi:hypothetical protein
VAFISLSRCGARFRLRVRRRASGLARAFLTEAPHYPSKSTLHAKNALFDSKLSDCVVIEGGSRYWCR